MLDDLRTELIRCQLGLTVPFLIGDWQRAGGPTERDFDAFRQELRRGGFGGAFSEGLLYPQSDTAAEANRLSEAIALLAFAPGGVRCAGLHFCAAHAPGGRLQDSQLCPDCCEEAS